MTSPRLEIEPDASKLAEVIARRMEHHLAAILPERAPRVLLTGGTIAIAAYELLRADALDWSSVDFWFGDERYVPADLPDRNDGQARKAFLNRVGATRIHAVADNDCSLSAAEAADLYAMSLPIEPFDLALFGVGPDGHVASLFPGFAQLAEGNALAAAVFDSPKPPPVRITLTYTALNNSNAVWFLVSGSDKADAVARALAPSGTVAETPARGVQGMDETCWFLDEAAAAKIGTS
jgi:6-phosphogluconolactonase